jgi:hypothetical protein
VAQFLRERHFEAKCVDMKIQLRHDFDFFIEKIILDMMMILNYFADAVSGA